MRIVSLAALLVLCSTLVAAQSDTDAKITKEQATKVALESVGGGSVKDAELEKEEGKLVWSFDIAVGKQTKEVWVDAMTGAVVRIETESMNKEKSEASLDKAEKVALKSVPGEVVKKDTKIVNKKTVYSFEIKTKDGKTTEVDINAKTMKIVQKEVEGKK